MPTTYYIVSAILLLAALWSGWRTNRAYSLGRDIGYQAGLSVGRQITQELGNKSELQVHGTRRAGAAWRVAK